MLSLLVVQHEEKGLENELARMLDYLAMARKYSREANKVLVSEAASFN